MSKYCNYTIFVFANRIDSEAPPPSKSDLTRCWWWVVGWKEGWAEAETRQIACELMNLIQVLKISYLLISQTILSQLFFKSVLCARHLHSSSSRL